MASVLYLAYDGATEPLAQSQIISYLAPLADRGHDISLLTFEKPNATVAALAACERQLGEAGIRWLRQRYHKRPTVPATAFDMATGVLAGIVARLSGRIDVLHARSHVPAVMGLALKKVIGGRLIFDFRNFWADEKVDAGAWPRDGALWRSAKTLESVCLDDADHVVTLTERARHQILAEGYGLGPDDVTVIPTCVRVDRFRRAADAPAVGDGPRVVYSGSLGGRYQDALVGQFFAALRTQAAGATLQIWTRQDPGPILRAAAAAGAPSVAMETRRGGPQDVAAALARAHIGLSFLSDGYANRSSLPTKIPEYLASGLTVVTSPGVGDLDDILKRARVGVVLPTSAPDAAAISAAATEALALARDPALPQRARECADACFSVALGIDRYDRIYRTLATLHAG